MIADGAGPVESAAIVAAHALRRADRQTVPQLAATARRAVLRVAPATVEEQQQHAQDHRAVWVEHGEDGSSRLVAECSTHDIFRVAAAIWWP